MMTIVKRTLIVLLIVGLFAPLFMEPVNAAKANTLGYYEEKLAQYKKQAEENRKALNKTQSEINYAQNQIEKLKKETLDLAEEVKKLNLEIDGYSDDIKNKILESKQLLEYFQLTDTKNIYLEYVFKAESVTEFIDRSFMVKEIVNYNTKIVEELEQMIEDNHKRESEIEKRNVEIEKKQEELANNVVALGEEKSSLTAGGVDTAKQIKIYEEQVATYKKLGCKSTDVIGVDCAVQGGTGIFRRPTKTGYITQEAKYVSETSYHRAVDIGSNNGTKEKIYPVADGTITAKYNDKYGALTVVIEHYNINDGKTYSSLYAHLSSYAPGIKVGNKITSDQYIGYMGDTGYSFGVHLHLEIFPCRLYNLSDKNCSTWAKWDAYGKSMVKQGWSPRKLISFPSGLRNPWNTR